MRIITFNIGRFIVQNIDAHAANDASKKYFFA